MSIPAFIRQEAGIHHVQVTSPSVIMRGNLIKVIGGNRRKPTQTWREHANSTQKDPELNLTRGPSRSISANDFTTVQPYSLLGSQM